MNIHRIALALAIFTTMISSSYATEWKALTHSSSSKVLIDLDSYSEADGTSSIWTKNIFSSARELPGSRGGGRYVEQLSLLQFRCDAATFRLAISAFYDEKGKVVAKVTGDEKFEYIIPDSTSSEIGTVVCQVQRIVRDRGQSKPSPTNPMLKWEAQGAPLSPTR